MKWPKRMKSKVILFGVRSALVVEYEESCYRAGIEIECGVSLYGSPRLVNTSKVVNLADFDPQVSFGSFYACSFFPETRKKHFEHAISLGLSPAEALVDPTAILARTVRIDDASFVNAGAIIGAVTIIGTGVLINRAASIGHHGTIGDFVSIGPGATLASNVVLGANTVIGAGATLLPDVRIGENCVVAGGAVVRSNVPDGTFVAGVPAKPKPFDRKTSSLFVDGGE
jgi:sugar O-acyltransferase (sialic acid O-acetyltransferase NeuD family)